MAGANDRIRRRIELIHKYMHPSPRYQHTSTYIPLKLHQTLV